MLFVDLVEFTSLAERLDAEDVREALGRYFEAARGVIARHGGTLEKFIGDAVMAVWGTPTSHENDSERAIRAGLEVVAAVPSIRVGSERPMVARAAVATGEAAVTLPAAGQGLVAGDLVNTAARLQKMAPKGGLLADETTYQLAQATVDFEPTGERRLRGKRQPVAVWRAVGVRPRRRRGAHDGAFVGRDEELGRLKSFVHGALEGAGGPRCAFVGGIAGIGKSRLCWELQQWLAIKRPDVRWLAGRAADYGDAGSYVPLVEVVRTRLGLREDASGPSILRAVKSAVGALTGTEPEQRWLVSALEVLLLPGGNAATSARDDLFAAWRRFLHLAAATRPTVLVFEDAQWVRPEMLEFIAQLAVSTADSRLAVIIVARPELRDIATGADLDRLRIGPLTAEAMDSLLAALSPELAVAARRLVRQRADGVPLYAVELLRMLLDRGSTAGRPLALEAQELPTTLRALLSARIDALPAQPRATLLLASVLGQRFTAAALGWVSHDPNAATGHLPLLLERDFLAAGDGSLAFVQGLVREVAYRTLGRRERRQYELAAAIWYEGGGQGAAEARAQHLWSAHSLSRDEPDAAALADQTRDALVVAADAAAAGAAPLAALDYLDRALTLVTDPAGAAGLHERAGAAARLAAELEAAESHFRKAIELRQELGQTGHAARSTARLAGVLLLAQRNESALHELDLAWRGASTAEPDVALAELAGQLARVHMIQGQTAPAVEWADRAIELADALSAEPLAIEAHVTRGTARVRGGDDGGLDELRRAAAAAESAGLLPAQLRALNNLAWLLVADDPRAAIETARGSAELAQRVGSRDMALQLSNVAGAAAVDTGEWEEAVSRLEQAMEDDVPVVYRIDAAISRTVIAALRGEGQPDRFIAALGTLGRKVDAQQRAAIEYARAWLAYAAGDFAEAQRRAALAARQLVGVDLLNALLLGGRAALWAEDKGGARRMARRLDELPIHGRVAVAARDTLHAGLAARAGRAAEAKTLYGRAEARWLELGLKVQLDLVRRERGAFANA